MRKTCFIDIKDFISEIELRDYLFIEKNPIALYILKDLNEGLNDGIKKLEYTNCSDFKTEFFTSDMYSTFGCSEWDSIKRLSMPDFINKLAKRYVDKKLFATDIKQMRNELNQLTGWELNDDASDERIKDQYIKLIAYTLSVLSDIADDLKVYRYE